MKTSNTNQWTIASGHYKLIQRSDEFEELYNLESDPYLTINLIPTGLSQEAIAEKEALEAALFNILN
ncbi:MAG: hypothetical protein VXX60_04225 [Bacteroidota bacterium]|nr:hypothetical protein [Bacteroidota bacterium]MEC8724198.1 hypothetical protein [Bacteroidota bacterium]